ATVTELQQACTERMSSSPAKGDAAQLVSLSGLAAGSQSTGSGGDGAGGPPPPGGNPAPGGGFPGLLGAPPNLVRSLQVGASGGVMAFAAPAPTICFEIYAAWRDNDIELARSKQEALGPAAKKVVSELGIPAVKYALDLNGYYGGLPRLPLLPLTAA